VFKIEKAIVYTVRFEGGDEVIKLTGRYGDIITEDMLAGLWKTSNVFNYVYKVSDYGLELPYTFGSTLGADGLPAENISVVAKFELVGANKTYTFNANGGKFADNETVKTLTAPYGTNASFTEIPIKAEDELYTYEFAGWAYDKYAATGTSFDNFVVDENSTLYAVYSSTIKVPYTITFDAGDGYFAGGQKTIEQVYACGEMIVPPADPVRDDDVVYRYVFIGWQPALPYGTTVSEDCTYTASYRTIRIDGTLEETGIIVSDGTKEEDINVGSIPGYTYALVGEKSVPTLTVTGNGLTFSGTSSEVCVFIESSAANVTFEDLTLSGNYTDVLGVLTTTDIATSLTVNISGNCVIRNTCEGELGIRFERPVHLNGAGAGAELSVIGNGYCTVYCNDVLNVDSLRLEIGAAEGAINSDGGSGEWLFSDSTVVINSGGAACEIVNSIRLDNTDFTAISGSGIICENFVLSGASNADITASGADAVALQANELKFTDFTGNFRVRSTNSGSPGIAVIALNGIRFMEGGTEVGSEGYDLGGTAISSFVDMYGTTYSSFAVDSGGTLVPVSDVTVKP
jgi:hypothetical protein